MHFKLTYSAVVRHSVRQCNRNILIIQQFDDLCFGKSNEHAHNEPRSQNEIRKPTEFEIAAIQ